MNRKFWIIIGTLTAVLLGMLWLNIGNDDSRTAATGTAGTGAVTVHITGKRDAKVTLTEYGDFQCSACALFYPVVEQAAAKYGDRIAIEFRHYPLTTIHQNAYAAARASEAAGKQGRFWEMYRLLYANQQAWSGSGNARAVFEGYAKKLGLNLATFKTDYASSATNNAINASIIEFNKRGLEQSTPTFLLNGKKIQPNASLDAFSKLIDEQLARAGTN